ncbi:MAG: hypothetical protein QOJ55_583 [Solirubrobacteraceae bacterium]|jgi:hypothetical protein|nr:hypothetical protein [Solirubrobacteraceae bacterium]MDX6673448.1 hypothetical protein [Solirubrobacteraceae bacterium]
MAMLGRKPLREIRDIASLARTRVASPDPRDRDAAGYGLMVRFARWAQILPVRWTRCSGV